jgi:hypothetical protein
MKYLTLFAVLLLATTASAGPLNWAKHHKRFLLMEGAAVTATAVGAYGLKHCRDVDVEHCTGHYGAAWGIFGFEVGASFAMTAVAEGCWKDGGGKPCYVLGYSASAFETWWGVHEYRSRVSNHTGVLTP